MKTATAALAAILLSVGVNAQASGLGSVPCATTCIQNLISDPTCNKGTGAPSISCVCTSRTLIDTVSCCIYKACSANDQARALMLAQGVCNGVDGEVLPQAAGCSGSASTAATTATGTETTTGAATSMTGSAAAAMTSSAAAVGGGMTSGTSAAAARSSAASSAASSAGATTTGAAGRAEVMVGGVAGVAAGLAGLLL